jgi:exodeoxyribonuclease VII small subunit
MTEKKNNFEEALEKLENLVTKLESGELSLEDSMKSFEEGIKLTRLCQSQLAEAELKVKKLIEDNGEIKTETLNEEV